MSYNPEVDRTFRINGAVSIAGSTAALFVQGMEITLDANSFQRDFTGNGTSVFTQNGDIVGTFSFNLKNTIDLFDATSPATNTQTLSYWMEQVAGLKPPVLAFIQTFKTGDSDATGDEFGRIKFNGRIMTPKTVMNVGDAIEDVEVTGEITVLTSVQRESS